MQSHAVSTGLAIKIYKKYGDESLAVVQNTPYRLVQDIHGIGFKTADKIAQALGLSPEDPARIEAGIAYTLNRMAEEGHVYVPQDELEPEASEILNVAVDKVAAVIDNLENEALIKRETITYALPTPAGGQCHPARYSRGAGGLPDPVLLLGNWCYQPRAPHGEPSHQPAASGRGRRWAAPR